MSKIINIIIDDVIKTLPDLSDLLQVEKEAALLKSLLIVLQDRFQHPKNPFVVVLCGPTGAGKSHLFNLLTGGKLSPSSYKRPCTVAPVLAALPGEQPNDELFLNNYQKVFNAGPVSFDQQRTGNTAYVINVSEPPWNWPHNMILIDTPDFDSIIAHNEDQSLDMALRSDVMLVIVHQAKYADQSIWEFLEKEKQYGGRPLLIVLNRVTAEAVRDDFQNRLQQEGIAADLIVWPEESAAVAPRLIVARNELTKWLEERGGESEKLLAKAAWQTFERFQKTMKDFLEPRWRQKCSVLDKQTQAVISLIKDWAVNPQARLSLNLPGETKEALLNNLSSIVSRSDLWAAPRRFISKPFTLASDYLKKIFGWGGDLGPREKKIYSGLAEASREALVAAVHEQARTLAAICELDKCQRQALSLSDEEIQNSFKIMNEHMDYWLKEESSRLLSGLPLGQKAVFYFVQLVHIALVLGLLLQTGGIPGTEVLVGGAFGPVISKLTGGLISREVVTDFEQRARAEHNKNLSAIFNRQGEAYLAYLKSIEARLKAGAIWDEACLAIEKEARRLWN